MVNCVAPAGPPGCPGNPAALMPPGPNHQIPHIINLKELFLLLAQQIYSIGNRYKDKNLPSFFNDLFRLLANCFLLLGCVTIPVTIG